MEIFDFHRKTWNIGSPMLTNRHGLGVGCIGGPLYAIGGHDGWSFVKTVERYDPETCTWSYVASMSHARCTLGVGVLENRYRSFLIETYKIKLLFVHLLF